MSAVLDFPVKPEARPYVDAFAEPPGEPEWLARYRRHGIARFAELGFPNRRSENWRYLDLDRLARRPLLPGKAAGVAALPTGLALGGDGPRLVLVDGVFAPGLSRLDLPAGAWLGAMGAALAERPELVRENAADTGHDHPFAALNAAFFADGFVLDLNPGVALDRPIEIIHVASGTAERSLHTRSLVRLGAGSCATIIESFAGSGHYWRNDFARWHLDDGAALTRIALVEEAAAAVHLGIVSVALEARSRLDAFALLLDGGSVRHEVDAVLAGDDAVCHIDGGFIVAERDEANIVTTIDHAACGGETRELIKGVAGGRGHAAFQGRIIVREGAQRTDAHQLSRNLILGRRAAIDAKPELEILADDVKCGHGASVGDLDEAALFYLRTRGIPEDEARRLLVEGFLREPVESIADPVLREHVLARLAARLARLEE